MSHPALRAAPYSTYVHIMLTAAVAFWLGATGLFAACTVGQQLLPEELYTLAVAVACTLAATMVWCVDHVESLTAALHLVINRSGTCGSAGRDPIPDVIRQAPPAPSRIPVDENAVQVPGATEPSVPPGTFAKIYQLGKTAGALPDNA